MLQSMKYIQSNYIKINQNIKRAKLSQNMKYTIYTIYLHKNQFSNLYRPKYLGKSSGCLLPVENGHSWSHLHTHSRVCIVATWPSWCFSVAAWSVSPPAPVASGS